jgi:hypothetical protein
MADEKAPEKPSELKETDADPKLTFEKVELDTELDNVVGGISSYQKDYDNCFGIHLTPPKVKDPQQP